MSNPGVLVIFLYAARCSEAAVLQTPYIVRSTGGSAQLRCEQDSGHNAMYWYQHQRGKALQLLCYSAAPGSVERETNTPETFSAARAETKSFPLNITALKPGDSAVYFCASSQAVEAFFGEGTRLTVLEKDVPNREPNVVLFDPSPLEISQKKKATLVCLATNFYPGYVTLTWSVNGKNRTEGVKTDDEAKQDGGSRMYSLSSRLRLSMQEWFNARNSFQCTVHMYHPDEKDVQRTIMGQEGCGLSEESYRRHATSAKFTYILFLCKAALYGFIVTVLVWRFKGSDKQFT